MIQANSGRWHRHPTATPSAGGILLSLCDRVPIWLKAIYPHSAPLVADLDGILD